MQTYDEHGNLTELAYFDAQCQPVVSKRGFAKRKSSFDDHGREVKTDYFGTDGLPILDALGRAARCQRF